MMNIALPWKDARDTCSSLLPGSDLVAIESEEEDSFVVAEVIKGGTDFQYQIANVWTGCNDLYKSGSWVWSSTDHLGRDNVDFHGEGAKCGNTPGQDEYQDWKSSGWPKAGGASPR